MISQKFKCCNRKPSFSIVYSVAGDKKYYDVCSDCISLDCFSKYILSKTTIQVQNRKIFQNEISEQNDENKTEFEKVNENNNENDDNSEESEDNDSITGGFIQ